MTSAECVVRVDHLGGGSRSSPGHASDASCCPWCSWLCTISTGSSVNELPTWTLQMTLLWFYLIVLWLIVLWLYFVMSINKCGWMWIAFIRYDSVYLTCSKKLTGSQLSLPHGINKKLKCETKNKLMSVIGPVQSSPNSPTPHRQECRS